MQNNTDLPTDPQGPMDYKNIFEVVQESILVLLPNDPEFTIVTVNQAFEKQTKTKREVIVGQGVFESFPYDPRESFATGIEKLRESYRRVIKNRASDTIAILKYNIRNPEINGSGFEEHYWSIVNSPVFNSEGTLVYIIAQPKDITELMHLKLRMVDQTQLMDELQSEALRMESEIVLASKLYADSQRAIKEREYILSVVSHNIKNIISSIKLATQALSKDNLCSGEVLAIVQNILQSTEVIERLILDMLDFGKIESGTLLLKKDSECVEELVIAAMDSMRPRALERKVKLLVDLPSEDLQISCDKNRIIQVLWKLIGNAIKFTSENGEVRIKVSRLGDNVQFSITDSGPGIAAEQIPKIFDLFWEAKETGSLGIGLGLSIVKGIVESHGGKIWLESQIGKGSQFHFTIKAIDSAWKAVSEQSL